MTRFIHKAAVCAALWTLTLSGLAAAKDPSLSRVVLANGDIALPGLILTPPAEWKLHQDAISDKTIILGFAKGDDYVTFYVKPTTGLSMSALFQNGVKTETALQSENHGPFTWQNLVTSKAAKGTPTNYMSSFLTEWKGFTYYGYSRSQSKDSAIAATSAFLDGIRVPLRGDWSLTGPDYTGKKYYLGFGDRLSGFMGNEVKYDVKHTHDIFTKQIGGDYIGDQLIGTDHGDITNHWQAIRDKMTADDMYVQYSSGHGSTTALMAGVSYKEIRDNALAMPAKEIVIFIMSCYSGNLVELFNKKKDEWKDWGSQGRTLMVMSSSQADEESQTGPGTDKDEPNGPYGSAGSAFGHALWKALIGYSDGYVDGVKDGFISLGEIRGFTEAKVKSLSGGSQNTSYTGVFNPSLIMNKVPSQQYLESLVGVSTEGMSDAQVMELIQKLDSEMAVQ